MVTGFVSTRVKKHVPRSLAGGQAEDSRPFIFRHILLAPVLQRTILGLTIKNQISTFKKRMVAGLLGLLAGTAQATVLTFDGLSNGLIPGSYGDRVTSTSMLHIPKPAKDSRQMFP